jgi:hypothetical protein
MGSLYYPTYSSSEEEIESIRALLDTFIINLKASVSSSRMYLVIYQKTSQSNSQFKSLLAVIKNFVFKTKNISPKDFILIVGGKSSDFRMDIFHLSKELPPPVPSP